MEMMSFTVHSQNHVPVPPIGVRIEELRQKEGISREELAKRLTDLGWARASGFIIYKISNGLRAVSVHEAAILAKALNCSISYLVGETERPKRK